MLRRHGIARYTHEEEREFLEKHLYPALQKAGLEKIKINLWDHNKERLFECASTCVTASTNAMIDGFAFLGTAVTTSMRYALCASNILING